MLKVPPPPQPTQLIVFADDWGRHPSSSQHLVRELLPHYPTLWVNTVGTRTPRLGVADLKRGLGVVRSWLAAGEEEVASGHALPEGLEVVSPKMYPGFRRRWQRRFNANRVADAVNERLHADHRHVVITTLPITADLVGKLDVDRWLYTCVDNYAQWPGSDHAVMDAMERELANKVDAVACVSDTLGDRLAAQGRGDSELLTHGVDSVFWSTPPVDAPLTPLWPADSLPVALFWGLIDSRLDAAFVDALAGQSSQIQLVLAGPTQAASLPSGAHRVGPIAYDDLPAHAAAASVLVMPYIDAPVTRAMQPLKLKEYLTTMKPVVVRDLPATRPWADCCDLASDAESFARLVAQRIETGAPACQLEARRQRLPSESWSSKAEQLAKLINAG